MSAPILLRSPQRTIEFPRRPLVMGIININDDSFSGDGTLDIDQALSHASAMVKAGADIIDVGAESARTNREAISIEDEVNRLVPFISRFNEVAEHPSLIQGTLTPPLLSLNTWRPEVAAQVLPIGGDILNDIGALPDDRNARLCAQHDVALLIMHSIGLPKIPHTDLAYPNIWQELEGFFKNKLALCEKAGLHPEATILDPGIDFAKQKDDNLLIYRYLERLGHFQRPILLPISRKTVIGDTLGIPDASQRDAGTIASLVAGMQRGAHIFRVHNVAAASAAVRITEAVNLAE